MTIKFILLIVLISESLSQIKLITFPTNIILDFQLQQQYILELHPQVQGSFIEFNQLILNGNSFYSDNSLKIKIVMNRCLKAQKQQCEQQFKYLKENRMVRLREQLNIDFCLQCLILIRVRVEKPKNDQIERYQNLYKKFLLLLKWDKRNNLQSTNIRKNICQGQLSWLQIGNSKYYCSKDEHLQICILTGLIEISKFTTQQHETKSQILRKGDYCIQIICSSKVNETIILQDKDKPYPSKYFLNSYIQKKYPNYIPLPFGIYQYYKQSNSFLVNCSSHYCLVTIIIKQVNKESLLKILTRQTQQVKQMINLQNVGLQTKYNISINLLINDINEVWLKQITNYEIIAHNNAIPYIQFNKKYSSIITNINPMYLIAQIPPYGLYITIQFQLCIQCQITLQYGFKCQSQLFSKQNFKYQERLYHQITQIQITPNRSVQLIENKVNHQALYIRIRSKNYAIFNFKVKVYKNLPSVQDRKIKTVNQIVLIDHNQTNFIIKWNLMRDNKFQYILIYGEDKQLVYKYTHCPYNYFHDYQANSKVKTQILNVKTNSDENLSINYIQCNQYFIGKTIYLSILAQNQHQQHQTYEILIVNNCGHHQHINQISIVLISAVAIVCLLTMLCLVKWVFTSSPQKRKLN